MSCRTLSSSNYDESNCQEEKIEKDPNMDEFEIELKLEYENWDHLIMHQQEELIEIQKCTE
jgi:hypothetical protein